MKMKPKIYLVSCRFDFFPIKVLYDLALKFNKTLIVSGRKHSKKNDSMTHEKLVEKQRKTFFLFQLQENSKKKLEVFILAKW